MKEVQLSVEARAGGHSSRLLSYRRLSPYNHQDGPLSHHGRLCKREWRFSGGRLGSRSMAVEAVLSLHESKLYARGLLQPFMSEYTSTVLTPRPLALDFNSSVSYRRPLEGPHFLLMPL